MAGTLRQKPKYQNKTRLAMAGDGKEYLIMYSLYQKQLNFNHFYKLPDVMQNLESFEKMFNCDLSELDDFSLRQESFRIKLALVYIEVQRQPWLFLECGKYVAASDWLEQRQKAIQKERKRRRRKHGH